MLLGLSAAEQTVRLRADLRMGLPVVIDTAGVSYLVAAIETLNAERLKGLRALGGQPWEIATTARQADTQSKREDIVQLSVPANADLTWLQSVVDPSADLHAHVMSPIQRVQEVPSASKVRRAAITLCKQSRLLPAALIVLLHRTDLVRQSGLHAIALDELLESLDSSKPLALVASAPVPLAVSEAGQVHVFRSLDGSEEHYAIEIGKPSRKEPVLTRLHSACFTGDLIGSLKCDCGPQLQAALQKIGEAGSGVVLYMNQEGRGIGLANKMRAYFLQAQGLDTVEANHQLGFQDDERDFRLGAAILQLMGFSSVRLMTNNPRKVATLNSAGLEVIERVPMVTGKNPYNAKYLATKAKKSGHLL